MKAHLKNKQTRKQTSGELETWLSGQEDLLLFAKDQGLVPNIHVVTYNYPLTLVPENPKPSSSLCRLKHANSAHILMLIHTHTHIFLKSILPHRQKRNHLGSEAFPRRQPLSN